MSSATVVFAKRATIEDLVRELLVRHVDERDAEAVNPAAVTSSFEVARRRGLLDRLDELAEPTRQLLRERNGGSQSKERRGSPAPWSAPAAELYDEILRGALEHNDKARRLLGWDQLMVSVPGHHSRWLPRGADADGIPQWYDRVWHEPRQVPASSVAVGVAGRTALRGLPGLLHALEQQRPEARMTARVSRAGVVLPGWIEDDVRSWHRRALELTGHQRPLERLPMVVNPDHASAAPVTELMPPVLGPRCRERSCGHGSCEVVRAGARRWVRPAERFAGPACGRTPCGHPSCERARDRRRRLLPWWCPVCRADSLRLDRGRDLVVCLRESCTDEHGTPSQWAAAVFEDGSADPWGDHDE